MDIALKSLAGGLFTGLILWISQTRFGPVAGMLLFFPVISVPTFFFLGNEGNGAVLRRTIVWGFWGIPAWILFAFTLYATSYRYRIGWSIFLSLLAWLTAAAVIFWFRRA